uniref:Uncharacterized protein n=1 Tax=Anguilla anguilla TaxID=7936 RepID=A0A0E9XC29_ANGAN
MMTTNFNEQNYSDIFGFSYKVWPHSLPQSKYLSKSRNLWQRQWSLKQMW